MWHRNATASNRHDRRPPKAEEHLGLAQVRAFFLGDCSSFFIDRSDRIAFLQLPQEHTSPPFDSLSCLVKNLMRASGHGGYHRRGGLCLCQDGFC
jgi:hypothetical protein